MREPSFKIHTLNRVGDASGSLVYTSTQTVESCSDVWRVAWNATGTVLATSSEDGTIQLWRKDVSSNWICVQKLADSSANRNETRAHYKI